MQVNIVSIARAQAEAAHDVSWGERVTHIFEIDTRLDSAPASLTLYRGSRKPIRHCASTEYSFGGALARVLEWTARRPKAPSWARRRR